MYTSGGPVNSPSNRWLPFLRSLSSEKTMYKPIKNENKNAISEFLIPYMKEINAINP